MIYLKVFIAIIKSVFFYIFQVKSANKKKYYLAGKCLLSLSFRYLEKDKQDLRFFFASYIRAIFFSKINIESSCKEYAKGHTYFYDDNYYDWLEKKRLAHLDYFSDILISGSVWKNMLVGYFSLRDKLLQLFFETFLFLFLLPVAVVVPIKASVGLIFKEYIEMVNLLKILKEKNVTTLFYYSIFQKDSNISAILIQELGIKVFKITSLTPLKFWNSIIVGADKLMLCNPNQMEEIQEYKDTILVNEFAIWGPEGMNKFLAEYYSGPDMHNLHNKNIGFYSTASYIRSKEGSIVQYVEDHQEDNVKFLLAEYLKLHTDVRLIIYLHPKEKKAEFETIVEKHYATFFRDCEYIIAAREKQSSYSFEEVEIGIAMYSSIIYERLYFGYKCLIAPGKMKLPGKINNICAIDKHDFNSKINKFMSVSDNDYFRLTKLPLPGFRRS
jgi:hypothetical protein